MSLRFRERRMEQKKRERSVTEAVCTGNTHTSGTGLFQPVKMIENYMDDNAHPHLLNSETLLQNITTFLIRKIQFLYKEICRDMLILDR